MLKQYVCIWIPKTEKMEKKTFGTPYCSWKRPFINIFSFYSSFELTLIYYKLQIISSQPDEIIWRIRKNIGVFIVFFCFSVFLCFWFFVEFCSFMDLWKQIYLDTCGHKIRFCRFIVICFIELFINFNNHYVCRFVRICSPIEIIFP